jgi:hypothetical protein
MAIHRLEVSIERPPFLGGSQWKKKLLWTVRLGKILGKSNPAGHLADLLGEELVSYLWHVEIPK